MTKLITSFTSDSAEPSEFEEFDRVALDLLYKMILAREGDLFEIALMRKGRGFFQLPGIGHEAIAALGYLLSENDFIFPGYRDRALMHVRGVTVQELASDFLARSGSSSGGRNLPGHFSLRRLNIFSISSPVATQCLPAVGVAFGIKRDGFDSVVMCHIGDASTRQGEFLEAVAFALQESLPIVFMVEDNGYGISTPTATMSPRYLQFFPPEVVADIDGRDPHTVFITARNAIRKARRGDGPSILWCNVDRLSNHAYSDDQSIYRADPELQDIAQRDPIERYSAKLIAAGFLTQSEMKRIEENARAEISRAYATAALESEPDSNRIMEHLYSSGFIDYPPIPLASRVPGTDNSSDELETITLRDAVTSILNTGLAMDERMMIFGEDVEDPKGGVVGLTKGLSTSFRSQVINSPLAEATIVGAAVGMAATGLRPIVEIQFIDFIGPAFNQLISQVGNLRWRTCGDWACPLIIYAPYGGYISGGGMWHSQSNEGLFAHIPGIRIAIPSNPNDVIGLFWTAMHDPDPSIILVPRRLLSKRYLKLDGTRPIPFGIASLIQQGNDLTAVCWGNCVGLTVTAAERVSRRFGKSVEILDLRTIVPCDWDAIKRSVQKTGRIVIVQEDVCTCSFGESICSKIVTDADTFYSLDARPILVTRKDIPIPFSPALSPNILPSVADVERAFCESLGITIA